MKSLLAKSRSRSNSTERLEEATGSSSTQSSAVEDSKQTNTLQDKVLKGEIESLVKTMAKKQEGSTEKLVDFCIKFPEAAQQSLISSLDAHFTKPRTSTDNETLKTFFIDLLTKLLEVGQKANKQSSAQYAALCAEIVNKGPSEISSSYAHCENFFNSKIGEKRKSVVSSDSPLSTKKTYDHTQNEKKSPDKEAKKMEFN